MATWFFAMFLHAEESNSTASSTQVPSSENYVVSKGDKLKYRVVEDRDESKILAVSPTGEIDVPYYGRMVVTGKRLDQISAEIKTLLEKDLYYQATVLLSVEEMGVKAGGKAKQIFVVGQVRMQGAQELPLDEKYTVSRAIVKAGGFGAFANGKKVQLIRKDADGKGERITVDVQSVFKDGKIENDIELKPDDMVIVPEKLVNF